MAASDYTVRINRKEGVLEVTGPDKEWVDEKIGQLSSVVSDLAWGERPESAGRRSRSGRKPAGADSRSPEAAKPETPTRRSRARGARSEINEELRDALTTEVRQEFGEYTAARSKQWAASQSAQAAIIATFLHDRLGFTGVDEDDVYTVYAVMGQKSPGNIRSQLTNARQRARYFGGRSNGKLMLSHVGENFARFDSLDTADDASDDQA